MERHRGLSADRRSGARIQCTRESVLGCSCSVSRKARRRSGWACVVATCPQLVAGEELIVGGDIVLAVEGIALGAPNAYENIRRATDRNSRPRWLVASIGAARGRHRRRSPGSWSPSSLW